MPCCPCSCYVFGAQSKTNINGVCKHSLLWANCMPECFQIFCSSAQAIFSRSQVNRLCLAAEKPLLEAGSTGHLGQACSVRGVRCSALQTWACSVCIWLAGDGDSQGGHRMLRMSSQAQPEGTVHHSDIEHPTKSKKLTQEIGGTTSNKPNGGGRTTRVHWSVGNSHSGYMKQ